MSRPVKINDPIVVHENPYARVIKYNVEFSNFQKNYYVNYFGPRVGIVVVHQDCVLLVRQYRFLIDKDSLEIPGGAVEEFETPLEAIKRELFEETGVFCREAREIASYYPGLDNVENRTTVFLCENFDIDKNFVHNEGETTGIVWMPIQQCVNDIMAGNQLDALTIIGIMTYNTIINC